MSHVQRPLFGATPFVKCITCGYKGKGTYYCPGSFFIELILRLCLLIPGLIYSIRRLSNRGYICKQCGNQNVVKITKKEAEVTEKQGNGDKYDQLQKLIDLKEKGALTDEEFLIEKKHVIG